MVGSAKMILAGQNYKGLVVGGTKYRLLEEGIDFFCLSVRGRPLYVPKWIVESPIGVEDEWPNNQE